MCLWAAGLMGEVSFDLYQVGPAQWHAHAMIFNYAMAVIAGFLLTAAHEWTGLPTATGRVLGTMVFCWLVGRLGLSFGGGQAQ